MHLKKYLLQGIQSPICLTRSVRLLSTDFSNKIQVSELRHILREYYSSAVINRSTKISGSCTEFDIAGNQFYLKLFGPAKLITAARHIWASRCMLHFDIAAPAIEQTCVTSISGKKYYAILEQKIPGREIGETPWSVELARNFASGLARWHGISLDNYRPYQCIMNDKRQVNYQQHFSRLLQLTGTQSTQYRDLLDYAKYLIDDSTLFGELRISHGDINPHNIIIQKDFKVYWIDMDMIGLRPIWHDLATIMCRFSYQNSSVAINAFEEQYFSLQPQFYEIWMQIRNQWLFLRNVLEGIKWQTVHLRPGIKLPESRKSEPATWARRFFEQASVIMHCIDSNENTATLVEKMFHASKTPAGHL